MKAHVATPSSLERPMRGWKVQSKPSSVLPTGNPLSLSEVAMRRSSLRSTSRSSTRSRNFAGLRSSRLASPHASAPASRGLPCLRLRCRTTAWYLLPHPWARTRNS